MSVVAFAFLVLVGINVVSGTRSLSQPSSNTTTDFENRSSLVHRHDTQGWFEPTWFKHLKKALKFKDLFSFESATLSTNAYEGTVSIKGFRVSSPSNPEVALFSVGEMRLIVNTEMAVATFLSGFLGGTGPTVLNIKSILIDNVEVNLQNNNYKEFIEQTMQLLPQSTEPEVDPPELPPCWTDDLPPETLAKQFFGTKAWFGNSNARERIHYYIVKLTRLRSAVNPDQAEIDRNMSKLRWWLRYFWKNCASKKEKLATEFVAGTLTLTEATIRGALGQSSEIHLARLSTVIPNDVKDTLATLGHLASFLARSIGQSIVHAMR